MTSQAANDMEQGGGGPKAYPGPLAWERRSGAMLECDKTAIIHFTRTARRLSQRPSVIKGQTVRPKERVKMLGVVMNTGRRYKQHEAAANGLSVAMQLKRLRGLSPRVARQLFTTAVTPAMNYASNVWAHFRGEKETPWLIQTQAIGVQAVTPHGRFAASPRQLQRLKRALCRRPRPGLTSVHCQEHSQLAGLNMRICRRFTSLLQKMAVLFREVGGERLETIQEFAMSP